MSIAIVTGSAGQIGSEAVRFLSSKGFTVVGIDNDMRRRFFGDEASTAWNRLHLEQSVRGYRHHAVDIRDGSGIQEIFEEYGSDIGIIVHTAAQPSHDWAARDPITDFTVNAEGTLVLLEATRADFVPRSTFIFTSTNKVYGDNPNLLPLVEQDTRWEVDSAHPYAAHGIDESMSVDQCKHSLFGASKLAADVLVQEYGRYFGMNTGVFRGGCLTGGSHSGTELHGFLSVSDALLRRGTELQDLRLQGQAGSRQHPRLRSRQHVLAIPPEPAARAKSTTPAAAATAIARCSKRSRFASGFRGKS